MVDLTEIQSYKYQFITYVNKSSLIELQTWMKPTHMQADGIGKNASIIVYCDPDITTNTISALKATYIDVIFKENIDKNKIFSNILNSKTDEKTISMYYPVNVIMSRLPMNMIEKAITEGTAVLPFSKMGLFSLNSDGGKMALQTIYEAADNSRWAGIPDSFYMKDEDNVCTTSLEDTFKGGKSFYKYDGQFIASLNTGKTITVYSLNANESTSKNLLEFRWLTELFGTQIEIKKMPETSAELRSGELIWILVSRADLNIWQNIFKAFVAENRNFKVIHCSDEFCKDNISWYSLPNCKGVIRNYYRPECESMANVVQIPLGYSAVGHDSTVSEQKYTWSFEGTSWFNRDNKLSILDSVKPNFSKLYPKWYDPSSSTLEDFFKRLQESVFVPILRGNHFETFRLYETIEARSIPIIVREEGDEVFWTWLKSHLPILEIKSYDHAVQVMNFFMSNKEHLEKYRNEIYNAYIKWKNECKIKVRTLI